MDRFKRGASRPAGYLVARFVGLVTLIALVTSACGGLKNPTATVAPRPTSATSVTPGLTASPTLPALNDVKIDTALLDVAEAYKQGGQPAAEVKARETGLLNTKNELRVTLILADTNTQAIVEKVKVMGGRVPNVFESQIDVVVPLDTALKYVGDNNQNFAQDLASFTNVKEVQVTPAPATEGLQLAEGATFAEFQAAIGALVVEGVAVSGADKWHAAGYKGKGIKIGIIDGGFLNYKALLGKELPQNVTVKAFTQDGEVEAGEHGTGVAEIVHAMAPDAELILVAIDSTASFGNAVKYLTDEMKVQVIQHSMGWHNVRKDGNHFLSQQADYARGKGVLYVKSAGNQGDAHYTATFNPDAQGRHQFAPGVSRIAVTGGSYALLHLTWEAWTGDPVNYDLYLEDANGQTIASVRNVQGAQKPPYEGLQYQIKQGQKYYAVIKAVGQQKSVRLDLIGKNTPILDKVAGVTPSGSISAPGDAKGAFTIGAANFEDDKLEGYSSQGPTIDGRRKPDLSAPTRVSTQAYGPKAFFGTSSSTPHVSGAAALIFGAQPGATADQVQAFLQNNALDLEEAGPENKTGYGRLALGPTENATTSAPVAGQASARPSAAASARPSAAASARPSAAASARASAVASALPSLGGIASPRASVAPSRAPASSAPAVLQPIGPIPAGWQSYSGKAIPVAIVYPPDWTVDEDGTNGILKLRDQTGVKVLQILIWNRNPGGTTAAEQLEQIWGIIKDTSCRNPEEIGRGENEWDDLTFTGLVASCQTELGPREIYVGTALGEGLVWAVTAADLPESFDDTADTYFDPMLNSVNFGGLQGAPAPSARPQATATRTPTARAQPTATRTPTPRAQPTARPMQTPTPPPASGAALTVTPDTVAPGGEVEYTGTGFAPNTVYALVITNATGAVTLEDTVESNANGAFSGTITVGDAGIRLVAIKDDSGATLAVAVIFVEP